MNENEKKWYNEGLGLGKLKRYEEAIEAFEKAIMINPNNAEAVNTIHCNEELLTCKEF